MPSSLHYAHVVEDEAVPLAALAAEQRPRPPPPSVVRDHGGVHSESAADVLDELVCADEHVALQGRRMDAALEYVERVKAASDLALAAFVRAQNEIAQAYTATADVVRDRRQATAQAYTATADVVRDRRYVSQTGCARQMDPVVVRAHEQAHARMREVQVQTQAQAQAQAPCGPYEAFLEQRHLETHELQTRAPKAPGAATFEALVKRRDADASQAANNREPVTLEWPRPDLDALLAPACAALASALLDLRERFEKEVVSQVRRDLRAAKARALLATLHPGSELRIAA
jgi:hypothetical protein